MLTGANSQTGGSQDGVTNPPSPLVEATFPTASTPWLILHRACEPGWRSAVRQRTHTECALTGGCGSSGTELASPVQDPSFYPLALQTN